MSDRWPQPWRATTGLLCVGLLVGLAACSSGPTSSASSRPTAPPTTRPSGPTSRLSALSGGQGVYLGQASAPDLSRVHYVQREYAAAGTATSYQATGAVNPDGRWTFVPDTSAAYRTRVLVRAPANPAKFSGTVIVEWLNVSGGVDADPEWVSLQEEIVRAGDVWVGVSAQRIGVEGGPVAVKVEGVPGADQAGKGLKVIDPARYGTLDHPGDGYSYDIYTQVARALRTGAGLDGLAPRRLISAGESQSAFALVTYYNGVQPLSHAFDGFFVHSRGAAGLPLAAPGQYAGIANAIGGQATTFRTDQVAPILDIQTETDVGSILNSYAARQPDSDRFRLWEVAGTAHADAHLIGSSAQYIDCGVPINNGPMHIVAKAALRALTTWLTTGQAPVTAPRIEVSPGSTPTIVRNADGIALGGIRTPPVDVAVATLSGAPGPSPSTICLLLGSTKPFTAERLSQLYPSRADYLERYRADVDATIKAGFALPQDRGALLAFAQPSLIPGWAFRARAPTPRIETAAPDMTTTASPTPPSVGGRALDRLATRVFDLPPSSTAYTIARGVRVPVRDGVELAADLYRPASNPIATLLVRGPYGRSMLQALPFARIFAARGYNVLYVSSRGTFGSGGTFSPMVSEADDGHDVVAWMRDQPWYTGRFATLGGSYLGFTQWALLTDPPPDLAAAVISIGPHDFSEHAWGTGAFRLDFLGWSSMIVHQEEGGVLRGTVRTATAERRDAKAMDELPLVEAAHRYLEDRAPWYADWVTRPDLTDPYWAPMDLGVAVDRAEIPILLISGWQDLFLEQTLEQYRRLHERGVDVVTTIGPWSHIAVGAGAARITTNETFDWMEEHLAQRAPRTRASALHIYVTGADEWRDLASWPPATSGSTLYLQPHRDLSADPPGDDAPASSFVFDPSHPTPTVGGPLLALRCIKDDTELGERSDVVCWTTPVLDHDLEVLGAPVVELMHTSDNPHVDLFARISQVGADGRSHNVTEGYLRLDPDRDPGLVTLKLRDLAHRFVAGTRLRLLIAGGSHPQFARNLGTGDNPGTGTSLRAARHTIHHGHGGCSRLVLPVAGG